MKRVEKRRQLTVVAIVALVAIVAVIGLVINSAALSRISTGGGIALADDENLAGDAVGQLYVGCGSWVGQYKIIAIGQIWDDPAHKDKVVVMKGGRPPSIWLDKGEMIPGTSLTVSSIKYGLTFCSTPPWHPPRNNPQIKALLTIQGDPVPLNR